MFKKTMSKPIVIRRTRTSNLAVGNKFKKSDYEEDVIPPEDKSCKHLFLGVSLSIYNEDIFLPENSLKRDEKGNTLLHAAVKSGAPIHVIERLITPENIVAKNIYKKTPLHDSLYSDHGTKPNPPAELIKLLATPNSIPLVEQSGDTALSIAVKCRYPLEIVKLLITPKTLVTCSKYGFSEPLFYSLYKTHDTPSFGRPGIDNYYIDVIKELVLPELLTEKRLGGDTPLLYAIKNNGSEELVKLFSTKESISIADGNDYLPLHLAIIYKKDIKILRHLVDENTINKMCRIGTPLSLAILHNPDQEVISLLSNKETLTTKLNGGSTPLHLAIREGLSRQILESLTLPELLDQIDNIGTPLHRAIYDRRDADTIKLFLNDDVIYIKNKNGETPLESAFLHYKDSRIFNLLYTKEFITKKDSDGNTPFINAIKKNINLKYLDLLFVDNKVLGGNNESPLQLTDEIEVIKYLLNKGFSKDNIDNYGDTPLHYVKTIEKASLLITENNINVCNKKGLYPLNTVKVTNIISLLYPLSNNEAKSKDIIYSCKESEDLFKLSIDFDNNTIKKLNEKHLRMAYDLDLEEGFIDRLLYKYATTLTDSELISLLKDYKYYNSILSGIKGKKIKIKDKIDVLDISRNIGFRKLKYIYDYDDSLDVKDMYQYIDKGYTEQEIIDAFS